MGYDYVWSKNEELIEAGYLQKADTLEELAEKLNIATNTLSNIERGNAFMTSSTLEKISNIFQIEYSELFDFSTEKDCEKMYKNIITRLNLIKENPTILTYLDNITKILINN